jgi:catechol 2,3-dioxygenase-like lactoylglutathione lyase family enzyme
MYKRHSARAVIAAAVCLSASFAAFAEAAPADGSAAADPAASGFITGIKAAGIHARKIEPTLKFYIDGLGFVQKGQIERGAFREVFLAIPGAESATMLIVQNGDATAADVSAGPAPLVLTTRDIEKAVARLRQQGYAVTGAIEAAQGRKIVAFNDPEGNRVELVETTRR